ncbi:MAG: TatD family hydrolase [Lachnospiraceae bacterium]|nr:TatD family hydrolase [Lachnospiraceae bacterium]
MFGAVLTKDPAAATGCLPEEAENSFTYIDTHAHYDDDAFDEDREQLLGGLPALGVQAVVNVGASFRGACASLELAHRFDHVYAGIGIHPDHAAELAEHEENWQELVRMARDPRCVTIGEIGLDYHWMVCPEEMQQEVFVRQMELAIELDKPINVHSRDAAQPCFDLIRDHHAGKGTGIIHCFSGSAQMAREYVKMGYLIGVGGVVTFKNSRVLREVVEEIPLEHLVTETDCPYLAPTPYRGKRNFSGYIPLMIRQIAQIKGVPAEDAARVLQENARRVYHI